MQGCPLTKIAAVHDYVQTNVYVETLYAGLTKHSGGDVCRHSYTKT